MASGISLLVPVSLPPWEAGAATFLVVLALGGVAALVIRWDRDRE